MQVFSIDRSSPPLGLGRPVATIGNFDGLHVGHRAVIAQVLARARAAGERSLVVTFEPHPVKVLHPGAAFCRLKTLAQRIQGLEALGVDQVAVVRFDLELARLAPEVFAESVLVRTLALGELWVGPGFRFGHERAGDFARLESIGAARGFATRPAEPVLDQGRPVSSTRIREALCQGAIEDAARLLGEAYPVEGVVVRGHGRGRTLGFPTANLVPDNECLPAEGVYATRVRVRGEERPGATFLGAPATFGENEAVFETHLPGWGGGDLYGERLLVRFLRRLLRRPAA